MKSKGFTLIQLSILGLLALSVLVSLLVPQMEWETSSSKLLEVSVVIRESDSSLWETVRKGMEQAAWDNNAELRFLSLSADNDEAEQLATIQWETSQGTDVLIVAPVNPDTLSSTLQEMDVEIPVISLESYMEYADHSLFPHQQKLGEALAQEIVADWTEGVVVLFCSVPDHAGLSQRMEGAKKVLEAAGVPVRMISSDMETIIADGAEQLKKDCDIMLSFDAATTEQLLSLKEQYGLSQPLYGVGLTTRIAAGLETGGVRAVAAMSDYATGYLAVQGAIAAVHRKQFSMEEIPFYIVHREEIYELAYQKLLFPVGT